ncbi:Uncharacterized conserved protein [Bacillus sp. 491mf]|uniref:DUF1254 domain-containing protein n=1 Tax=Bacillus sp. 491mf TaxID=1761755 RepID=UPI0008E72604|nr:DUF1254 domain-containing protein [Bacillus sp. 491mf]SFC93893.1 Uncharacterized conserved protein [Bacillus sp. 491mf]
MSSIENLAYSIGLQAYIYGYPLLVVNRTRQLTAPIENGLVLNQFVYKEELANPAEKFIVSPNVDTLYMYAWLDVSGQPVILHVPNTHDRYYTVQLLDAWTNTFANIGRRKTGTAKGRFAIVGPYWKGTLPSEIIRITAPTNTVWALGRILVRGDEDISRVRELQKQFIFTTLSGNSPIVKEHKDNILSTTAIEDLSAIEFIEILNREIRKNPPPLEEQMLFQTFKYIRINPFESTTFQNINLDILKGVNRAIKDAANIIKSSNQFVKARNGWLYSNKIGVYGADFLVRAVVAYSGLGANVKEESIYQRSFIDDMGEELTGKQKYILHFEKDNLPEVDAFWSVTVYNVDFYLIKNILHRYAIGDRTKGLTYNENGSLDIYMQHEMPKGKESNWLPVPKGNFNLVMRYYQPNFRILNGSYQTPPVKKVRHICF